VYFILAVFEPFGLSLSTSPYKSIKLIGHGVISGGMVYLSENFVPRRLPWIYNLETWTIGKAIIHGVSMLLIMSIVLWGYTEMAFPNDPFAPDLLQSIKYTFILGVIPSIVILGWNYIQFLKRRQEKYVRTPLITGGLEQPIRLIGSSNGAAFAVQPSRIILCTAMGNYVLVYYENGASVERQMIRKTLTSLKKELTSENFIRCHRSHLVNMEKVLSQEGNTKGIKLKLKGIENKVQVSRRYVPIIREWISQSQVLD